MIKCLVKEVIFISLKNERVSPQTGQPIKEFIEDVASSFSASFLIGQDVEFPFQDESGNTVWELRSMKTAEELQVARTTTSVS